MYAVIKSGGKQYRVSAGQTINVEKLSVDEGATIELSDILMVADGDNINIGTPFVASAKVSAVVESHGRGDKIYIVKFRRRKHHLKRMGHRQSYTALKITDITLN